jgi:S1-C subfamily serine protease
MKNVAHIIKGHRLLAAALWLLAAAGPLHAQTAPQALRQDPFQATPQVVTVVQRLSGLQALSLLREAGDGSLAQVDTAKFLKSCQWFTNVTAGLALGDGQSVMVYLPAGGVAGAQADARQRRSNCPLQNDGLTVYDSTGKTLPARFVGYDARTGLSLLQAKGMAANNLRETKENALTPQQSVRVLAPSRAEATALRASDAQVVLKLASLNVRLEDTTRAFNGQLTQFRLAGAGLTPALVGGVAVNPADVSQTYGLVVGTGQNQAQVLPVPFVRAAAERIRARNSNVPRPWLGVQAQDVAALSPTDKARFVREGAPASGVVLLRVLPETPGARAGLQAGDFILQFDGQPVPSLNDFSYLIAQRNGGDEIALERWPADATQAKSVKVLLGEVATQAAPAGAPDVFAQSGLETLGLAPDVARALGAKGGRLILSVKADSRAARAGLEPGDVIEAVNGQPLAANLHLPVPANGSVWLLTIVRDGKRLARELLPQATR